MTKTRLPNRRKKNSDKQNETPEGMRPIGARALKSAIDTLRPWLPGSKVLDLFSGQGRFGLSTLQEGAEHVTFVEKSPVMANDIRKSSAKMADHVDIRVQDAFQYLSSSQNPFDIIFADPPFNYWNENFSQKLFEHVARLAKSGGIFLVKHPRRVIACTSFQGFTHWKTSEFGESQLIYFNYGQTESSATPKTPTGDLSGDV